MYGLITGWVYRGLKGQVDCMYDKGRVYKWAHTKHDLRCPHSYW